MCFYLLLDVFIYYSTQYSRNIVCCFFGLAWLNSLLDISVFLSWLCHLNLLLNSRKNKNSESWLWNWNQCLGKYDKLVVNNTDKKTVFWSATRGRSPALVTAGYTSRRLTVRFLSPWLRTLAMNLSLICSCFSTDFFQCLIFSFLWCSSLVWDSNSVFI